MGLIHVILFALLANISTQQYQTLVLNVHHNVLPVKVYQLIVPLHKAVTLAHIIMLLTVHASLNVQLIISPQQL